MPVFPLQFASVNSGCKKGVKCLWCEGINEWNWHCGETKQTKKATEPSSRKCRVNST